MNRGDALIDAVLRAPVSGHTWRMASYALVSLVLAIPAFVLPLLGLVFSVLSLVMIGLPALVGVLFVARGTVGFFRAPARWMLGWDWPTPPPMGRRGILARGRAVLGDGRAWRALAYCFVKLPLAAVTGYATVLAVAGGLFCLTSPAWWLLSPTGFGLLDVGGWGRSWYVAAAGFIALLVFPWMLRLLVAIDHRLATALLAPSRWIDMPLVVLVANAE